MIYTPGGNLEENEMVDATLPFDSQQEQNYPGRWGGIHHNPLNLGGSINNNDPNLAKALGSNLLPSLMTKFYPSMEMKKHNVPVEKEQVEEPEKLVKQPNEEGSALLKRASVELKKHEANTQYALTNVVPSSEQDGTCYVSKGKEDIKISEQTPKTVVPKVAQQNASASMSKAQRKKIRNELVLLIKERTGRKTLNNRDTQICLQLLESMAARVKTILNNPQKVMKKGCPKCRQDMEPIYMETTIWLEAVSKAQGIHLSENEITRNAHEVVQVMSSKLGTLKL